MRIVGGIYRHRTIIYPEDSKHIRPTKDRIREAIFSALGNIDGFTVLDLYAGSGAMGLEALSRGSKFVSFVDILPLAIKTVNENISSLKVPIEQYEVIKDYDLNALDYFKNNKQQFDLVFIDPPYEKGQYQLIVDLLINGNLLKQNAIIVIETNKSLMIENIECRKIKEYHYGEINVYCYWR